MHGGQKGVVVKGFNEIGYRPGLFAAFRTTSDRDRSTVLRPVVQGASSSALSELAG
jgi:hypothetical protein